MFQHLITIATAVSAILQVGIQVVFLGTLTVIMLASFAVIPMPY